MTAEQKQYCKPIEGKETKLSGEYCDGLVDAILSGTRAEALARNPSRFISKNANVFFARPSSDPGCWKQVLDELEQRFANTHKRPVDVGESDPIMRPIRQWIAWKLQKLQVAWTPQARRWPTNVPFTHRSAILCLNSGEMALEVADMSQVNYPKQRFTTPVRLGILFFGFPEEGPQDEAEIQEPEESQPPHRPPEVPDGLGPPRMKGFDTEIWFEDPPKEVDKKLQYSLARLHVNMGHAPRAELVRMLAASGNLSRKVLMGLDALRCGSCIRTRQPRPPPTSSTAPAFTGYFGEVLQSDVVYLRTIKGEAVPVIGITEEATAYYAVQVLPSRHADDVLKVILSICGTNHSTFPLISSAMLEVSLVQPWPAFMPVTGCCMKLYRPKRVIDWENRAPQRTPSNHS